MNIHPQAKRLAALVGAIMVAVLVAGYVAVQGGSAGALAHCDVKSLKSLANRSGEPHDKTYYLQQAQACQGEKVTTDGTDSTLKTLAGANPTLSTSTSNPKSSPKKTTPPAHKQAAYVFYANSSDKAAPNDFGPQHAMAPKLKGKTQDMNLQQGVKELKYRISRDPMLTASYWCQFNLKVCANNGVAADAKTKLFMHDPAAWKAAKATVFRKIDKAVKAGKVKREILPAGWYTSTNALHGDSFPEVRSAQVYRDGDATMSGLMFTQYGFFSRFLCGFQIYTWTPAKAKVFKPMPKPSPGMTRTVEGVPEKLVWVCNPATGKQIEVPVSKKGQYPPNTGKCKPVTSTSTSTPPPGTSTTPPSSTTTPPPGSTTTPPTSTPPPSSTTPPTTPPSSSMPPKCPPGTKDPACHSLPPGSSGTPTNNPPSKEPVPTHTGPTYNPTKTSTPTATSTPSTSRTTPPNEGPDPTSTATGGPTGCAVCG